MPEQVENQKRLSAPAVSVILPVYNGAATIRETIDSVLKQTFSDFELIILDDGSLDNTREIISLIPDRRLRYQLGRHRGLAASRNRGAVLARGKYLAFIDADDLWRPEKLQRYMDVMENNPAAGAVYAWVDFIDKNGRYLFPGSHLSFSGNIYSRLLVNDALENGSNILVRREVFAGVGGFDESRLIGEDWDFALRVAGKYLFESIPEVLVLYRLSAGSMSSWDLKDFEKECQVLIDHIYSSVPEDLQKLKPLTWANLKHHLFVRRVEFFLSGHGAMFPARIIWHFILRQTWLRSLAGRLTKGFFR